MNMLRRNASLRLGLLAAAAVLLAANRPAPAVAAAPVASLDIVPADTAFYSAMLRNREQFDAIANSKALGEAYQPAVRADGPGPVPNAGRHSNSVPGKIEAARHDRNSRNRWPSLSTWFPTKSSSTADPVSIRPSN